MFLAVLIKFHQRYYGGLSQDLVELQLAAFGEPKSGAKAWELAVYLWTGDAEKPVQELLAGWQKARTETPIMRRILRHWATMVSFQDALEKTLLKGFGFSFGDFLRDADPDGIRQILGIAIGCCGITQSATKKLDPTRTRRQEVFNSYSVLRITGLTSQRG